MIIKPNISIANENSCYRKRKLLLLSIDTLIIRMSCDMELEHLDIDKIFVTISWSEICICYKWRRIVFVIDSLVPWDDVGKKLKKT